MIDGIDALSLPATLVRPPPSAPLVTAAKTPDDAAKAFEAMVMGQMVEAMMAGLPTDGPFGGGFGEEVFRGFLVEAFAQAAAQGPGFGLAPTLRDQLAAYQAAQES